MVSDQEAAGPSDSRFSKNPVITTRATCAFEWNSDVCQACHPPAQEELQSIVAFFWDSCVSMAVSLWEKSQKLISVNRAREHHPSPNY